jgi:uncharacterized integral membrane protein
VQNALKRATPFLLKGSNLTGNQGLSEGREEGLQREGEQRTLDFGHQVRLVAIIVGLVMLALFTALNFDEVEVDMLVATQNIRLSLR